MAEQGLLLKLLADEARLHEQAVTAPQAIDRQFAADQLKAVRQVLDAGMGAYGWRPRAPFGVARVYGAWAVLTLAGYVTGVDAGWL
jgi:hypothetical protein